MSNPTLLLNTCQEIYIVGRKYAMESKWIVSSCDIDYSSIKLCETSIAFCRSSEREAMDLVRIWIDLFTRQFAGEECAR